MSFAMCNHPRTLTLPRRVSMTTYIIPPTVLYIKQHSITKKKYFGKTTQDILKYNGSGKRWSRHIKKHGKEHVITLWVSEPYTDSITISEFALAFSRDNNIVESELWANMKPENGLDGGITVTGPTGKQRNPSGPTGKQQNPSNNPPWNKGISIGPQSTEHKQNLSAAKIGKPSKKKGNPTGKQHNPHGPQLKVECPHCGLVGGSHNMRRYHFDNCKSKNNLTGRNMISLSPSSLP